VRIKWADVLKGFGILFVVVGHIIPDGIPNTAGWDAIPTIPNSLIVSYIYSFHMPLFFFASGYTYSMGKYKTWPSFLARHAKTIFIPFLFFLIVPYLYHLVFVALGQAGPIPWSDILGLLYANGAHLGVLNESLWFLPCLFLAQNLMWFCEPLSRKNLFIAWGVMTVLGWGLGRIFFPQELPWSAITAFNGASMMLAGQIFRKYEGWLAEKLKVETFPVAAALGALGAVLCIVNGRINMPGNNYGRSYILYYLTVACTLLFYIWAAKRLANSKFFVWLGANSIIIFGLHGTVMNFWNTIDVYGFIGRAFNFTIDPLSRLVLESFIVVATLIPCVLAINRHLPFCVGKGFGKKAI